MPTSVDIKNLKINKLTEAQYDTAVQGGVIGENELSVLTDAELEQIQVSALPTAGADELGNIYQYVGATDANYTNGYFYKCEGAGDPVVYSWAQVNVQPGSSYTAGTGIDITSGVISVTSPVLTNNAVNTPSLLSIKGQDGISSSNSTYSVFIGGNSGGTNASNSVYIGSGARSSGGAGHYNVCIGYESRTSSNVGGCVQLGYGTNSESGTFRVALSDGVGANRKNYKLLDLNGTIPTDRLTKVNTTITLAAADWSSNSQTVNVTGMTATGIVMVSPDPTDQADYTAAGIICSAQAAGTLTFTCDSTPANDIDVVVVML